MKTKFSFLILLSIFGLSNVFAQIPTNGLVGYWPFNGNANDESGNGNNGTVNGAILTNDRFGNSNRAYNFDGTQTYIRINSLDSMSYKPITYSCWINLTGYDLYDMGRVIIGRDKETIITQGALILFNYSPDTLNNELIYYTGATSFNSDHTPPLAQWEHVVFTWDAGNNARLYVNGVLKNSGLFNATSNFISNFMIGAGLNLSGEVRCVFNGKIDDIRIYNRALDINEIISLYNEHPCSQTMCVSADILDFGNVFIGYPESRQVTVFNNGSLDLLISNVTIDLIDYSVTPSFAGIDPGSSEVFTVTFAPQVVANYPATLTFHSNDSLNPSYPIALLGSGLIPPIIAATPDSILDTVYSGKTSSHTISINNTGGSNLEYAIDFNSWINAIPASGSCLPGIIQYSTAIIDASNMDGGDYSGSLSISSNDPGNLQVEIPVTLHVIDAPSLLAGTDTLDFGNVFAGYPDTLYLEVTNNGSQDLLISSISAVPAQYSIYPLYMSIDPGETEQVRVIFSSLAAGYYPGFMTLTSNDPVFTQQQIILTVQAIEPPVIAVNPGSLSAKLHPNQTISIPFTIINNGGSDLNFSISPGKGGEYHALEFDGVNDYACINSGGGLNGASQATIELWVKWMGSQTQGCGGFGQMFARQSNNWFTNNVIGLTSSDPANAKVTWSAFYSCINDIIGNTNIGNNQWRHIAISFKPGQHKLYIDGNLDGSAVLAGSMHNDPSTPLTIGAWIGDGNSFSKCIVDEVKIWNVVRTNEEIQQDMSQALLGNESGLLGYWNFDEGTGLNVFDKSPNGYNGILMNGVSWTDESAPVGPSWLTVSQDSGTISAHSSHTVNAILNATSLALREYNASIKIYSNDPAKHVVDIPVQLLLTSLVGDEELKAKPIEFFCYPNPFIGITTVMYSLQETELVTLQIFDNFGRLVAKPVNAFQPQGEHKIEWNAGNLPAGIYYCRLQAGDQMTSTKINKIQ